MSEVPSTTIFQATNELRDDLSFDENIFTVGLSEAVGQIFIYTNKTPTKEELQVTMYKGFPISWRHRAAPTVPFKSEF